MDLISKEGIELDLAGTSKDEILGGLVDVLVKIGLVRHREPLLATLKEREGLGSTGIGFGVAIPHGKCPELQRTALIFARTREEVDFDSVDGRPARMFFLLVAPDHGGSEHLHLLAKIARLVKNAGNRETLLGASTPEEVLQLFAAQNAF